ncbi:MAG: pyruvate, phosphate dikinase [Chloroflexi bacterium]|nr:pyruvate, phosphate dikinase [Chloroflexota bacterium]
MARNSVGTFGELTAIEQSTAGGKGGMLARLFQAGYPVPDGFVILPTAFDGDDLQTDAWVQVHARLERMRASNKDCAFAIRSSALSEDSAQASFAGAFETILDVQTDADIRNAIQTVHCSRLSERVAAYSHARGMETDHAMAIVVQRLIRADFSGVLFTADPVTGNRRQMTGNYVHGLGEQLVSGQANAESFSLQHPNGKYDGPSALKQLARELYKLGSRLERELGAPQDIEWAIADRKLYLLQSRPITTLVAHDPATGEWNDTLAGDFLWSNVNVGEGVPDVMTPLTWDVLGAYWDAWVLIPGYRYLGNIAGRVYTNLSVIASIYAALGKKREEVLKIVEGLGFLRLPDDMEIPLIPLRRSFVYSFIPNMLALQLKMRKELNHSQTFLAENPTWCEAMRRRVEQINQNSELIHVWRNEIKPRGVAGFWQTLLVAMHLDNLATPLRRKLTAMVGAEDASVLLSNLSGEAELASMGLIVGISQVVQGKLTRNEYLDRYGHRGAFEFELAAPRPAEDPGWLDRQVTTRQTPNQTLGDVETVLENQHRTFEAAWHRLATRYSRKAKSIRRQIAQTAEVVRRREAIRSEYVRISWVVRVWALRAGKLTGLGDDVFFLTANEVIQVLGGDMRVTRNIAARKNTYQKYRSLPPYPAIIKGRFDLFQWAADPHRRGDIYDAQISRVAFATDTIVGSAGSSGCVEGIVRRLDNLEQADQFQPGEILVTMQTNIGWTPLFPRAKAIVTDVGAVLSHAAIVARELGIPAVVGCGDATMRLKTGDRVRVDGGKGIVSIIRD